MRVIYSQELEMTARPALIFDQPAIAEAKSEFGTQRGQEVIWTVYRQLPPAIGMLTENQDVNAGSVQDYQVNFTIGEFGYAIGTSEKLDLLSYQGPISNIVRTLLGPQMAMTFDLVARNTLWNAPNLSAGVTYHDFPNAKTARSALASSDVLTAELVRLEAFNLGVRRVPLMGGTDPAYIALTHPAVIYDLRNDANWKNAQLYAGATRIFNGEEGMIHGVRFLKSDLARVANGGALFNTNGQTTLAASIPAGVTSVPVVNSAGFAVGAEITLHNSGTATTATIGGTPTTWTAPNGQDPTEETMVITGISGNTLIVHNKTLQAHSLGDYATDALDVYPIVFIGGVAPLGKGLAVAPEIRVSLPTDKLRRTSYIGWYALQGYGVIRDWSYSLLETAASVTAPTPFGY